MSLMKSPTLIAPCCAGKLLDSDASSLRKSCAGTVNLMQVRHGNGTRQRVHFIFEEVLQLKAELIEAARTTNRRI